MQKQLEFYFSPANLATDDFMSTQIQQNNGYFPLDMLLKFNKLKQMNATLDSIKQCIKASPLLQLDEEECKVKPSISQEFNPEFSILVSGIPKTNDLNEHIRQELNEFGQIDLVKQTGESTARVFYSTKDAYDACLSSYSGTMKIKPFPIYKGFFFKASPLTLKVDITSNLDCVGVDFTPESGNGFALLRDSDARDVTETEFYFDVVVATKEQEEEMRRTFTEGNKKVKVDDGKRGDRDPKRGRGGRGGYRGRGRGRR